MEVGAEVGAEETPSKEGREEEKEEGDLSRSMKMVHMPSDDTTTREFFPVFVISFIQIKENHSSLNN